MQNIENDKERWQNEARETCIEVSKIRKAKNSWSCGAPSQERFLLGPRGATPRRRRRSPGFATPRRRLWSPSFSTPRRRRRIHFRSRSGWIGHKNIGATVPHNATYIWQVVKLSWCKIQLHWMKLQIGLWIWPFCFLYSYFKLQPGSWASKSSKTEKFFEMDLPINC